MASGSIEMVLIVWPPFEYIPGQQSENQVPLPADTVGSTFSRARAFTCVMRGLGGE